MKKFIEVINGTATDLIVAEGGAYKGKRYGKNSPDATYIEAGLFPLIHGEKPTYNPSIEELVHTDSILDNTVTREYSVASLPLEVQTQERYSTLERILNAKSIGLKKIAIDKPFMQDAEAINNQYLIYEEMYVNALAGRYDTALNEEIILANETAKASLSEVTLLLNTVRSVLENAIATNDINTDILLSTADAISLTKEELTVEKLAELKLAFGA